MLGPKKKGATYCRSVEDTSSRVSLGLNSDTCSESCRHSSYVVMADCRFSWYEAPLVS
jgi:hypothetical protein